MPTITGSISLSDLIDGSTGASIVFTNESHTFPATADGEVSTSDLGSFSSEVAVFGGANEFGFQAATTVPATGMYSILQSAITFTSGADLTAAISTLGVITVSDSAGSSTGFVDAGTTIDSVSMTVPIRVNIDGTTVVYNRVISFAKAKGGSAKTIRVTASRQSVEYAFGSSTPKSTESALTFLADFQNFADGDAAATWSFSTGGSATFNPITGATGSISGTQNSTLGVTTAQFDTALATNRVVTYRVTRDNRTDQVSVAQLVDAEGGYNVIITVTDGSTVFKNNSTTARTTLRADIYRGGVLITPTSYAWRKNGVTFTPSVSGQTLVARSIILGAADVEDNGTDQFSCEVTF